MNPTQSMAINHFLTIRDAVHLDMGYTNIETNIIDTPQIQRLRQVKQLGFTYLVYPSATHTRFEHSLGTCYLTGMLIDKINSKGKNVFSKEDRAVARAFALVHDASHIPFGHTLEDEHNIFSKHERTLVDVIDSNELKAALSVYYKPVREIVEFIANTKNPETKDNLKTVNPYLVDIVAGTIGADLLDYLKRDNLFTGLRKEYDPRVFDYLSVFNNQLVINIHKHSVLRVDAASDIMDLLRMRYTLTEKVYYHHTKVSFGSVLAKAIRLAKKNGLIDLKNLLNMGDWELLSYLADTDNIPTNISTLTKRISPRNYYRRSFVLPKVNFSPKTEFIGIDEDEYNKFVDKYRDEEKDEITNLEKLIADEAKIPFENVVAYCPSRKMQLKEANVLTRVDKKVLPLSELTGVIPIEARYYYTNFQNLWTFYVFTYGDHETAIKVGRITEEILNKKNQYDPNKKY